MVEEKGLKDNLTRGEMEHVHPRDQLHHRGWYRDIHRPYSQHWSRFASCLRCVIQAIEDERDTGEMAQMTRIILSKLRLHRAKWEKVK